jgi:hypothetical protein
MASAAVPGVPAVVDAAGLLSPPDDALIARMEKGELIPISLLFSGRACCVVCTQCSLASPTFARCFQRLQARPTAWSGVTRPLDSLLLLMVCTDALMNGHIYSVSVDGAPAVWGCVCVWWERV